MALRACPENGISGKFAQAEIRATCDDGCLTTSEASMSFSALNEFFGSCRIHACNDGGSVRVVKSRRSSSVRFINGISTSPHRPPAPVKHTEWSVALLRSRPYYVAAYSAPLPRRGRQQGATDAERSSRSAVSRLTIRAVDWAADAAFSARLNSVCTSEVDLKHPARRGLADRGTTNPVALSHGNAP